MNDDTGNQAARYEAAEQQTKRYKAALDKLWTVGLGSFGATWEKQYGRVGDEVYRVWLASLRTTFSPETIVKAGAKVLAAWDKHNPPSLGQLRLAMSQGSRPEHQTAPALPKPKRELAPAAIRKMLQDTNDRLQKNGRKRDAEFLQHFRDLGLHTRWGGDPKLDE